VADDPEQAEPPAAEPPASEPGSDASGSTDAPAEPGSVATPSRSWPPATVLGIFLVVVGVAALAYAFLAGGDSKQASTTSTSTGPTHSSRCAGEIGSGVVGADGRVPAPPTVDPSTNFAKGRKPLCGFGEAAVTVTSAGGQAQLCLLLAETEPQRQRGLMEVRNRSLGGYDGMVFTFPVDQPGGGFYMRNTPMPLSIAYIGADGKVLQVVDMAPCGDVGTCPTYPSTEPFRTAIEVPQGRLPALGIVPGATVTVEPPATACAPKT
jgi:uncharacterized membrane protein (UPF0127 family)